ncbi:MAG: hypothetical protein R2939_03195 [Kofleriaceae bacterium]
MVRSRAVGGGARAVEGGVELRRGARRLGWRRSLDDMVRSAPSSSRHAAVPRGSPAARTIARRVRSSLRSGAITASRSGAGAVGAAGGGAAAAA